MEQKTLNELLTVVAKSMGMTIQDYAKNVRVPEYTTLRQIGCYLARKYFPNMRLRPLCAYMNQPHGTISLNQKTASNYIDTFDSVFLEKYLPAANAVAELMGDPPKAPQLKGDAIAIDILELVAHILNMPKEAYTEKSRKRNAVHMRFIASILLREYMPKLPYKEIGKLFGGQDHTTVMNSVYRGWRLVSTNADFANKYKKCKQALERDEHKTGKETLTKKAA